MDRLIDDDVIAEALKFAIYEKEKKLVMMYRKLKNQTKSIDPEYVKKTMLNPFATIVYSGKLAKKSVGLIERW